MLPSHRTPQELSVREMLPSSRHSLPAWEILLDRRIVGHVRERHYRSIVFYEAVGLHNVTGEEVSLQVSTDLDERVRVVVAFWLDPLSARQHLPWGLRRLHGLV